MYYPLMEPEKAFFLKMANDLVRNGRLLSDKVECLASPYGPCDDNHVVCALRKDLCPGSVCRMELLVPSPKKSTLRKSVYCQMRYKRFYSEQTTFYIK